MHTLWVHCGFRISLCFVFGDPVATFGQLPYNSLWVTWAMYASSFQSLSINKEYLLTNCFFISEPFKHFFFWLINVGFWPACCISFFNHIFCWNCRVLMKEISRMILVCLLKKEKKGQFFYSLDMHFIPCFINVNSSGNKIDYVI